MERPETIILDEVILTQKDILYVLFHMCVGPSF